MIEIERRERAHFEALRQIRYGYREGYHTDGEIARAIARISKKHRREAMS